jgi:16S rRNA processing protein RimM
MVCVGVVTGAHGVCGHVRIRSFTTDPANVAAYGPVFDENGRHRLDLRVIGKSRGQVIARVAGIVDRSAAASLRGRRLFVPRTRLPETGTDEYYHVDLIGLVAFAVADSVGESKMLGRVRSVDDFGAGSVVEIDGGPLGLLPVPFTREAVPEIDLGSGRIYVRPIPGLLEPVRRIDHDAVKQADLE